MRAPYTLTHSPLSTSANRSLNAASSPLVDARGRSAIWASSTLQHDLRDRLTEPFFYRGPGEAARAENVSTPRCNPRTTL